MKHIKKIIVPVLFVLVTFISFAQDLMPPPPSSNPNGGPAPPPPAPGLPIDAGLIIFMVVAIIYGVYKIVKFNKAKTS